jgi:uncharacterized membrane protein
MSVDPIILFFHQVATVTWIGGMIFMHFILGPAQKVIAPQEGGKLFGAVAKRFTIAAWSSIVVLLVTGLMKVPFEDLFNTSTHYSLWLTVKHVLIIVMIIVGLIITFMLAPKMGKLAPKPNERPSEEFIKTQGMLSRLSLYNMIFGLLVLLSTSIMEY